MCIWPQSLWVHLNFFLIDLDGLGSLACDIPSRSYTLSTSSSTQYPEPCRKRFESDIQFRAKSFNVSHFLHNIWLWFFVYEQFCLSISFSDDGWTRDWSNEYRRIPIKVILLLPPCCFLLFYFGVWGTLVYFYPSFLGYLESGS